ncbi:MAG: DUF4403 family protein, partial [Myxococcota bacterium]
MARKTHPVMHASGAADFSRLPHVPRAQELLDTAFGRASKATAPKTAASEKGRMRELARLGTAGKTVEARLNKIVHAFPPLDRLHPFYRELADVLVGIDKLKKSLGAVGWAHERVGKVRRKAESDLRASRNADEAAKVRRSAYGRIASFLEQIDGELATLGAAREALQKELGEFDRRLAAFDLPGEAARVWKVLSTPLKLTDSLWLAINPAAVRIGLLAVRGDTLVTTVGLSANPRVIGGTQPEHVERPMPPPQDSTARPPVLHLLTEARMPYDVASAVLSRELRGTTIRVAGRKLTVDSLRLLGVGDGRVAVGLTVRGAVDGTLYAVGHPVLDTVTAELYMP